MLRIYTLGSDYEASSYAKTLKDNCELTVGKACTKHHLDDSVFYIQNCGRMGYRAVKFYNDSNDYRVGSLHIGPAEAYTEAICLI